MSGNGTPIELVDVAVTYNRQRIALKVDKRVADALFEQRDAEGLDLKAMAIAMKRLFVSMLTKQRAEDVRKAKQADAAATNPPSKGQYGFAKAIERELDVKAPDEAWRDSVVMGKFIAQHADAMPAKS